MLMFCLEDWGGWALCPPWLRHCASCYVFGPFRIAVSKPIIMQPHEVPYRLSSNGKTLDLE